MITCMRYRRPFHGVCVPAFATYNSHRAAVPTPTATLAPKVASQSTMFSGQLRLTADLLHDGLLRLGLTRKCTFFLVCIAVPDKNVEYVIARRQLRTGGPGTFDLHHNAQEVKNTSAMKLDQYRMSREEFFSEPDYTRWWTQGGRSRERRDSVSPVRRSAGDACRWKRGWRAIRYVDIVVQRYFDRKLPPTHPRTRAGRLYSPSSRYARLRLWEMAPTPEQPRLTIGRTRGHGGYAVRLPASRQCEPGFNHHPGRFRISAGGDRSRTMPLVFSEIFRFPRPCVPGAAPFSLHFTLIGSQDLDFKSRPNLFTHLTKNVPLYRHALYSLLVLTSRRAGKGREYAHDFTYFLTSCTLEKDAWLKPSAAVTHCYSYLEVPGSIPDPAILISAFPGFPKSRMLLPRSCLSEELAPPLMKFREGMFFFGFRGSIPLLAFVNAAGFPCYYSLLQTRLHSLVLISGSDAQQRPHYAYSNRGLGDLQTLVYGRSCTGHRTTSEAAIAERLDCSASHRDGPGSIPGRFTPDFRKWESHPDDAVGLRVFQGNSFPPLFHSGAAPYPPCFVPIRLTRPWCYGPPKSLHYTFMIGPSTVRLILGESPKTRNTRIVQSRKADLSSTLAIGVAPGWLPRIVRYSLLATAASWRVGYQGADWWKTSRQLIASDGILLVCTAGLGHFGESEHLYNVSRKYSVFGGFGSKKDVAGVTYYHFHRCKHAVNRMSPVAQPSGATVAIPSLPAKVVRVRSPADFHVWSVGALGDTPFPTAATFFSHPNLRFDPVLSLFGDDRRLRAQSRNAIFRWVLLTSGTCPTLRGVVENRKSLEDMVHSSTYKFTEEFGDTVESRSNSREQSNRRGEVKQTSKYNKATRTAERTKQKPECTWTRAT
ncbi:hypothetical protein PR048_014650 [Dryococelus australis]|uniref:Uncharacterized protein n=1 Tax=Dryococelus australis TaxID=614101 RepID=A0ABQ9HET5_9NEOP|nr:hypothetical protein PR048_014650 [Dryococelus australis]